MSSLTIFYRRRAFFLNVLSLLCTMRFYSFLIVLACWLGLGASLNEAKGNDDFAYRYSTVGHSIKEQDGDCNNRTVANYISENQSELHTNQSSSHAHSTVSDRSIDFTSPATQCEVSQTSRGSYKKPCAKIAATIHAQRQQLLYPKHSFW